MKLRYTLMCKMLLHKIVTRILEGYPEITRMAGYRESRRIQQKWRKNLLSRSILSIPNDKKITAIFLNGVEGTGHHGIMAVLNNQPITRAKEAMLNQLMYSVNPQLDIRKIKRLQKHTSQDFQEFFRRDKQPTYLFNISFPTYNLVIASAAQIS